MANVPFHFMAAGKMLGISDEQKFIIKESENFAAANEKLKPKFAVLVARSGHGQVSTWPIAKLQEDLIVIAPDESDLILTERVINQVTKNKYEGGAEFIFDENFNLLVVNYLNTKTAAWTIYASQTNYFEQFIRGYLNLPLGRVNSLGKYAVCGELKNAPGKDEFYPYLHLMAHNPNYKFDKSENSAKSQYVTLFGDDLDFLCQQIKHAQDYYSAKIQE